MKKVIFISSTGGHLVELLQLKPLFSKVNAYLITEKTKSNEDLKQQIEVPIGYLAYGTKKHLFSYLFIFAFNILKSLYYFIKFRPDAIVTTGTHTAVPMCYIAHFFKKKVIWIETFANSKSPTEAGRMVYKIADTFIVQWESMLEFYPDAIVGGAIF
ncbi:MAG: PssD/Cps14F family polysaccharide biosynthesis glycosyltransferase [Erysipelotrichaceae bacterium]|nr:PssD/Cps14F family polysaccharide biosynthesis glycosyltransferase [Erysipelotrichaceae bacterium]